MVSVYAILQPVVFLWLHVGCLRHRSLEFRAITSTCAHFESVLRHRGGISRVLQAKMDHLLRPIDHGFGHIDRFPVFFGFNRFTRTRIAARNGIVAQTRRLLDVRWNGNFGRQKVKKCSEVMCAGSWDGAGDQDCFESLFGCLLGVKAELFKQNLRGRRDARQRQVAIGMTQPIGWTTRGRSLRRHRLPSLRAGSSGRSSQDCCDATPNPRA